MLSLLHRKLIIISLSATAGARGTERLLLCTPCLSMAQRFPYFSKEGKGNLGLPLSSPSFLWQRQKLNRANHILYKWTPLSHWATGGIATSTRVHAEIFSRSKCMIWLLMVSGQPEHTSWMANIHWKQPGQAKAWVSSAGRGPETQLQPGETEAQWHGHHEELRGICTWSLITEPPVVWLLKVSAPSCKQQLTSNRFGLTFLWVANNTSLMRKYFCCHKSVFCSKEWVIWAI